MSLFSERNGYRKPIDKTYLITPNMYRTLSDCCDNYLKYLAYKFPQKCLDNGMICDVDRSKLSDIMSVRIPELYRDDQGKIVGPRDGSTEYDQYALLDYIEYIALNMRDYTQIEYHSYFKHYHLSFSETSEKCYQKFRDEINRLFKSSGLQYNLTDKRVIERNLTNDELIIKTYNVIEDLKEPGVKELITEALSRYKNPHPSHQRDAMEKIWDAFERLKTYYTDLNKKKSVNKIIEKVATAQENNCEDYETLIDEEFIKLTNIGNKFTIRHHETDKIDIKDPNFYSYFFERCLSLILLVTNYLE